MTKLNKINLLQYILIYLIFTLLFLTFSYPYEIFILTKIQNFTNASNIPLDYSKINSTPFNSTLQNVKLVIKNKTELNDIKISYSPLSLITNSLNIKTQNKFFTFEGNLKKDILNYNLKLDLSSIEIENYIRGFVNIAGDINIKKIKGTFNISSSPLKINIDKQVFNIGELKGTANLLDNQIIINNMESTGDLKIISDGKIFLNNRIELSSMNIKCSITYNKNAYNLYIRGTINNPTFYTR